MSEIKKIAVIGTSDTVLPFRSIGAEAFEVETSEQLVDALRKAAEQKTFGIIFVEENLAESVLEVISDVNEQHRETAVTLIPGASGGIGLAVKSLSSQVTRAIGMDIFTQKGGN
ncbi:MAG: V-type ATP synthase subunit F [Brevinemataceae bacterium]